MDSRRAREILVLYRPGGMDAADPQMAEALEQVQRDPELATWFEKQSAVYTALRAKLQEIPVPADLKRKIILERPKHHHIIPLSPRLKWLAAAAAIALLGVAAWLVLQPPSEDNFTHYRLRMASNIQRLTYAGMDIVTNDQAPIREYFHAKDPPANFVLPAGLQQLPAEGGTITKFENRSVEMLCLYDGVDAKGKTNELWVFITRKTSVPGAPPPGKPDFLKIGELMTASWTTGDTVYLLAAAGDEKSVQKYLH